MTKIKVFVYGTLLEGYGNHKYFLSNAKKLGEHITSPNYTMLHLGGFPGVIQEGDTAIKGEVYEVSEEELRRLDRLEGYDLASPTSGLYNRKEIHTEWGKAWIYIYNYYNNYNYNTIPSGSWKDV